MDSQGFTANGQTVKDGVKTAAGYAQPGAAGLMPAHKARIVMNDVVGVAHSASIPDSDEKHIAGLRTIQHRSDIWMGEFFGGLAAGALAWVARAANKSQVATVFHAVFAAPFEALRQTKLENVAELPSQYMRSVAKYADESALKAAQKSIRQANKTKLTSSEIEALIAKTDFEHFDYTQVKGAGSKQWVSAATQKANSLEAAGKEFSDSVGSAFEPVTKSLRGTARSGLESLETTGLGKTIQSGMQKMVNWREERNVASYAKHLDKAHEALTKETPDFFKRAMNFFTGKKPAELGTHEALNDVTKHLNKARVATTHADRVLHTDAAADALQKLALTADAGLKTRVTTLTEAIQKSGSSAKVLQSIEGASGKGLAETVKVLGKAVGRLPLFGTILGVSAAAGISATLLTHRHENQVAKKSLDEIANAIGANSPLALRLQAAHSGEHVKHLAKTSFEAVGDIANAAMGMAPHGGGAAMMGAVMLPMAGTMLIKDNPLLNSYANLRKAEKTNKPLPPEEKLECVKQLVSSVPSVEAHGGYYNRLTSPIAEALIDQNLTAVQIIQLLANDQKFTALAADVQQKQKAQVATAAAEPTLGANDTRIIKAGPEMAMPHMAAGTSVQGVQHDGLVQSVARANSI